jgi:hypothetical protein
MFLPTHAFSRNAQKRKNANFSVDRIQRLNRLLRITEPLRIWRESDVATKTDAQSPAPKQPMLLSQIKIT